ncbi:HNH endonuclease [archaeon BMS3Abin17]|nr:HNH endonuclease [archaeon BMS3Abin17]
MDKNSEKYKEFRKRANKANRKYFSKPEVREKKNAYSKKYRIENKGKISEYGKRIRALPKTKERIKIWKEKNREHIKEYYKRPEVRARKKVSNKKHYNKRRSNPENVIKEIEEKREYRKNNLEKTRRWNSKYYKSPKGLKKSALGYRERKRRLECSSNNMSKEMRKIIFERDKVCVYCGGNNKLGLDHIVSLKSRGNSLFNNFVVSCRVCNSKKGHQDVIEWYKQKKELVPKIILELLKKQKI